MAVAPGDHDAYLAYLSAGRGTRRVIGDITPSYALLGAEDYALMNRIAPQSRFVFLMREPVSRLWSSCRMQARRSGARTDTPEEYHAAALKRFDNTLAGKRPDSAARCDYARTLTELYTAIPAEQVFVGFFENLFDADYIKRITDCLGIAPLTTGLSKVVHRGVDSKLDAARKARAREWLSGQYTFVSDFVDEPLPETWLSEAA